MDFFVEIISFVYDVTEQVSDFIFAFNADTYKVACNDINHRMARSFNYTFDNLPIQATSEIDYFVSIIKIISSISLVFLVLKTILNIVVNYQRWKNQTQYFPAHQCNCLCTFLTYMAASIPISYYYLENIEIFFLDTTNFAMIVTISSSMIVFFCFPCILSGTFIYRKLKSEEENEDYLVEEIQKGWGNWALCLMCAIPIGTFMYFTFMMIRFGHNIDSCFNDERVEFFKNFEEQSCFFKGNHVCCGDICIFQPKYEPFYFCTGVGKCSPQKFIHPNDFNSFGPLKPIYFYD